MSVQDSSKQTSGEVLLVRKANFIAGESTPGMERKAAITDGPLTSGITRIEPGVASAWHHHGSHATSLYLVEGQLRVDFGDDGRSSVVGDAGDFILVPANCAHRESNPGHTTTKLVATRLVGTGPSTIHLDKPTTRRFDLSHATAEDYEPFVTEGVTFGEVHWLRIGGSHGNQLAAGLWRCEPKGPIPFLFNADETIHTMQGKLEITLDDGQVVVLEPGNIASFEKGTKSTWVVKEPIMQFFVISG